MKTFNGAIAGKVVAIDGEPDIGAPPEITFVPAWMADEARQYRTSLLATPPAADVGLGGLVEAAEFSLLSNDARSARDKYISAIRVTPDDGKLWLGLTRALLAISGNDATETSTLNREATDAGWNAYQLLRTTAARADALAAMAVGLDRRDLFRQSLQAYEASLALVNSASLRAEYEDLKARKGFRVIEHTVDADTPSPRVCAQFSEELVKTGVDYAPFVTVDNAAPKAVEARDKANLCRRPRARQALRRDLPRGAACRDRRGHPGARRAVDLHSGSRRLRPLHRRQLRPAGDCPPRHPGCQRQHAGRRHEAVPHRRPLAGAAAVRLPVPQATRFLRHREHRRPAWRAGLGGQTRHRQPVEPGDHHQLPGR